MIASVTRHSRAVSREFVKLFMDDVWKPFADAGIPEERWDELAESIEHVRPLAGQTLLAVFRRTMDEEVEQTFEELARRLARLTRRRLSSVSDAQTRPTAVLLTLSAACIAFALSQTLVVPALPALAQEFDASPSAVSWVLTGFLVSASIATPIVGKLGDLYGKGRMLTVVLTLFSLGAVINALAPARSRS